MQTLIDSFKNHGSFSNFWVRNGFIVVVFSILANHLVDPENFPLHRDYQFPLFPIGVSIISGCVIIAIAKYNFNYFETRYFTKKINPQVLLRFLLSTLGYISILYLLLYFGLKGWVNGTDSYSMYHLLSELSINLLISTIAITLLFSSDIYRLHKLIAIEGTLKVRQGGKLTLIRYPEIAFMYSENKIVYIVKTDGAKIITDFTLNEVESKIGEQSFFRANRQIILHCRAIEQVQAIENGKLSLFLKPIVTDQESFQITISRYKRQSFMDWFERKL